MNCLSVGVSAIEPVSMALIDTRQVLHDHPAAADIHMADLGIAHLAVRQADGQAGRCDPRGRAGIGQVGPDRRTGLGDGVIGAVVTKAPAVQNAQDNGLRMLRRTLDSVLLCMCPETTIDIVD